MGDTRGEGSARKRLTPIDVQQKVFRRAMLRARGGASFGQFATLRRGGGGHFARQMMVMTRDLDKREKIVKNKVTCFTCHHGRQEPDNNAPEMPGPPR